MRRDENWEAFKGEKKHRMKDVGFLQGDPGPGNHVMIPHSAQFHLITAPCPPICALSVPIAAFQHYCNHGLIALLYST
jgi:hypothetical protein